jgi:hypothetical protein
VNDPAKLVALSFWRDEAAVEVRRNNEIHRLIQAKSRQDVFRDYRLRVAAVLPIRALKTPEKKLHAPPSLFQREGTRDLHRANRCPLMLYVAD